MTYELQMAIEYGATTDELMALAEVDIEEWESQQALFFVGGARSTMARRFLVWVRRSEFWLKLSNSS